MSPQTTFQVVCTLLLCLTLYENGEAVPSSPRKISEHPVILVVSYDGFRFDYFNRVDTPAMNALKASGVRVPYMEPVFPTNTFPNHQSIVTGVYAETHGIVDNTVFDPKFNKTLSGYNDDPGFWNYHSDVLPIWIRNEMAGEGRTSGCLMWAGCSQPYGPNNNLYPTYYHPGYDESVSWEDRVDTVISWMTNASNPANLVFLYFDEPDTHGHEFGPNAAETVTEITNADTRTAHLVSKLREAGIFDQTNLIMLSDHGMKEVTSRRIINITSMIDSDLLERRHGGTPFIHLTAKEGRGDELYNQLLNQSRSNSFTILKKEDMTNPYHYGASRRVMDYVLLADAGYAFDDFYSTIAYYNQNWNFIANDSREYGVHGYNNMEESMRPYFLAHGPVFKKDFDHEPFKNVDIVPLISTILRIPQGPSNGSLVRVIDMIEPSFLSNHRLKSATGSGNHISSVNSIFYVSIVFLVRNVLSSSFT